MRILIADDEVTSLRLLERTLQRAGYEVTVVGNGREAADQLCSPDGPRLALLDWGMPELDGPGVCREVRRQLNQRYVYIVLLTARNSKLDVVEGLESGADDYMVKPFNIEELKARLRTGARILQLEDKLVEAREDMRFRATHDPLTSLLNRGTIMDLLKQELTRSSRESGCTVVMLGDLDHFKSVNDTHGHVVGDEVLQGVAHRLLTAMRSYDLVGRYGGEEFLIVLNNCALASASERAEQIRRIIANSPLPTSHGKLPVTMSLGVIASAAWGRLPAEEVLREVDAALYAAKAAGRNCCSLAVPALTCEHTSA
ncbi:MAG: GGDEF domain-containing response regulator [Acidobacteriaceae bacterium]